MKLGKQQDSRGVSEKRNQCNTIKRQSIFKTSEKMSVYFEISSSWSHCMGFSSLATKWSAYNPTKT